MTGPAVQGTPRQRARAVLTSDIKEAARARLAAEGSVGLSMRAIAQDVGLASASALYRYFPNRDALLTALIVDAYTAIGQAAEAAEAAVHERPVLTRWLAICEGLRAWSIAHPHEYTLVFGSPIPGYRAPSDTIQPASRVPTLLLSLLADLDTGPGDHPPPAPGAVRRSLRPVLSTAPPATPPDLVIAGVMAWTYLLGALSLEVFGHRHNIFDDQAAFFHYEMRRIAVVLGIAGPAL